MIYKCLVVDDEDLARELIETHLSQLDNFEIVALKLQQLQYCTLADVSMYCTVLVY